MLKNNRLLKEVSLYISLVFYLNGYGSAALLVYTKNNITMFCLVESNPVKLETSYSVILPPMLSVLWHIQRFIKVIFCTFKNPNNCSDICCIIFGIFLEIKPDSFGELFTISK